MRQCEKCGKPVPSHGSDAAAVLYDTMINTLCDECRRAEEEYYAKKKQAAWAKTLDGQIETHFVCSKCQNKGASIERIVCASPGLGAALDIERHTFIAASCPKCGYTEFYNPRILGEKPPGFLQTLFDLWVD